MEYRILGQSEIVMEGDEVENLPLKQEEWARLHGYVGRGLASAREA